jgi:excisionase family DNA binding protein
MKPQRLLFDMEETAEMLGISTRTLVAHVNAGDIRYVLIGKRTRKFTQADIDAFIEAKRQCPSIAPKIRRTGTLTSLSTVGGFMAQRAQRLAARQKPSKPVSALTQPKAQADESQA